MFGKKRYTGIDIQGKDVNIATVEEKDGRKTVTFIESLRFDQPLFDNGRLQHWEAILKAFATINKQLISKHVHYSIPTQHVILRSIKSLPNIDVEGLNKIIRFELGESIHLPFPDPIYDFNKIGVVEARIQNDSSEELFLLNENGEQLQTEERSHIMLVASSRELAEDLAALGKLAKQKVGTIELRATAIHRVIEALHPEWLTQTSMIIDFALQHVDIHIIENGLVVFTRSLPVSKADYLKGITGFVQEAAVAQNVDMRNKIDATFTNLIEDSFTEDTWDIDQYVNDVVNEIERAQSFYRFNINQEGTSFQNYILTGLENELLLDRLSNRLEQPFRQIVFDAILDPTIANNEKLQRCSTAVGLALRMSEQRKPYS